jgi:hypothetical protein
MKGVAFQQWKQRSEKEIKSKRERERGENQDKQQRRRLFIWVANFRNGHKPSSQSRAAPEAAKEPFVYKRTDPCIVLHI